jgi:GntR family transcriptional regulator of gluconate operon
MLKRENISDKLAEAIGKKIIHNELKSGEIIMENQISKEWDISRSPVRDALHILKNKWLLDKSPKGQYMVPVLDEDYVANSYDAWIMFYQYTCSRATKYITDEDSTYLLSVVEKIERSIGYGDFDMYVLETSKFLRKILQIANNPIIERSASELVPTSQRIQFAAHEIEPSYPEKGLKYLWKCYECLSGKDSKNAAKSMGLLANISKEILVNHFNGKSKK